MWGAITGQIATYAGELTNDLREIVAAGSEESEGAKPLGPELSPRDRSSRKKDEVDDDLEEYVLDLERTLIAKRQEHESALKKIEELEKLVEMQQMQTKDLNHEANDTKIQRDVKQYEEKYTANELEIKRLNEEMAILHQRNQQLEAKCGEYQATIKLSQAAHSQSPPHSTTSSSLSDESLANAITILSKAISSSKITVKENVSLPESMVEYASIAADRINTLEGDVKSLKNAIHAFLLSQNTRLEASSSLTDWITQAKAKLNALTTKMVADQDKANRFEVQVTKLQSKYNQMQKGFNNLTTEHEALQKAFAVNQSTLKELASAADQLPEKESLVASLQSQNQQLQRQNEQLNEELAELNEQMSELKRVVHTQESSLQEEMHEKEEAAMDRLAELERMVYSLTEELKETKEAHAMEQSQWVEHLQANATSLTEQQTFELTTQLTLLEADKQIAEQYAERLQTELDNLHSVLMQFETDKKRQIEQYETQISTLKNSIQQAPQDKPIAEEDLHRVMALLEKKQVECDRLREALDRTAKHFEADVDNIDKRMAIQMMIQFHESSNKHDVLEVISRILGCTEQDKERLLGNPLRLKFRSLGRLFQAPAQEPPVDVSGKSFSDAWTEFLLDQVPPDQ